MLKGELRQMAGLKGCGKRINKHCDSNSDSIVTSDEWRACFIQGTLFLTEIYCKTTAYNNIIEVLMFVNPLYVQGTFLF